MQHAAKQAAAYRIFMAGCSRFAAAVAHVSPTSSAFGQTQAVEADRAGSAFAVLSLQPGACCPNQQ